MDVTRATAATRVDENGLVNYAEIIGDELVTNGDFELNSDWNNFSTPTTSEQSTEQSHTGTYSWKVIADATQEGIFSPNNFSITNGNSYSVSLWIYSVSGNSIKSGLNNTNVSVFTERTVIAGQWTNINYEATATSTGASYISILSQNSLQFFVDNVSVKELTRDNVPRIDYTGGGCPHILAEPQRRNLVTYSEVISNLSLLTGGAGTYTITDNYTNSPEGVQNASRVQMSIVDTNDGANYSLIALNSSMTNGVTREISFYAKSLTGLNQEVLVYWSTAKQIVTLTNDWQRFEISATSDNSGAVLIGTRGGTTQYYAGGDANLDFALWGLQVEDDGSGGGSSYATSYIPTSGSTVTRNQDIFTRDGIGSLINSTEGVLFVEMAALSDDGTNRSITLSDGSTNNIIQILFSSVSNTIRFIIRVGGVGGDNLDKSTSTYTVTDFNKVALKWKQNDAQVWINGTQLGSPDTNSDVPTGLNDLSFEYLTVGNNFVGKVKQLQVYKTALTDTQLAALTS